MKMVACLALVLLLSGCSGFVLSYQPDIRTHDAEVFVGGQIRYAAPGGVPRFAIDTPEASTPNQSQRKVLRAAARDQRRAERAARYHAAANRGFLAGTGVAIANVGAATVDAFVAAGQAIGDVVVEHPLATTAVVVAGVGSQTEWFGLEDDNKGSQPVVQSSDNRDPNGSLTVNVPDNEGEVTIVVQQSGGNANHDGTTQ